MEEQFSIYVATGRRLSARRCTKPSPNSHWNFSDRKRSAKYIITQIRHPESQGVSRLRLMWRLAKHLLPICRARQLKLSFPFANCPFGVFVIVFPCHSFRYRRPATGFVRRRTHLFPSQTSVSHRAVRTDSGWLHASRQRSER